MPAVACKHIEKRVPGDTGKAKTSSQNQEIKTSEE